MSGERSRFDPFGERRRRGSIERALSRRIWAEADARRRGVLLAENARNFRHGSGWSTSYDVLTRTSSSFDPVTSESRMGLSDIVDHQVSALSRFVHAMVDGMDRNFMGKVLETLDQAVNMTGNVVSSDGDDATDMMRLIERVEFACDRHGRPTMPVLHMHPSKGARMHAALVNQPREFFERLEDIKAAKEREATRNEAARIARFRWPPTA